MKPLRIAIDIDDLFGGPPGGGGQGRVIVNLIQQLTQMDRENEYTLFSVRRIGTLPQALTALPKNFRMVQVPSFHPKAALLCRQTFRWPSIERAIGTQDVVHAPTSGVVAPVTDARLIVSVMDLVCWVFPEGLRFWGRYFHRRGLRAAGREAACITCISDSTRRGVLELLGEKAFENKVRTIWIDCSDNFKQPVEANLTQSLRERFGLNRQYLVSIGTLEPRKNILGLLQAYAALPAGVREDCKLVLIGPEGWKFPAVHNLISQHGLKDQVLWTGYLPDAQVKALLQGARGFCYPSFYEGFGIPLLEAMWSDVPIVTSNLSSMPEVAGDAALLVDPKDTPAITAALEKLIGDDALRSDLIAKGQRQRVRFSFKNMAEEYLKLYTSLNPI